MNRMSRRRRALEIGSYVLLWVLAAVATFAGSRLIRPAEISLDHLAWLGGADGQIVGVDPDSGRSVEQLQVGGPGDVMAVTQGDGVIIVANTRTGEYLVISLPTLAARQLSPGTFGPLDVLLADTSIYVVDR